MERPLQRSVLIPSVRKFANDIVFVLFGEFPGRSSFLPGPELDYDASFASHTPVVRPFLDVPGINYVCGCTYDTMMQPGVDGMALGWSFHLRTRIGPDWLRKEKRAHFHPQIKLSLACHLPLARLQSRHDPSLKTKDQKETKGRLRSYSSGRLFFPHSGLWWLQSVRRRRNVP